MRDRCIKVGSIKTLVQHCAPPGYSSEAGCKQGLPLFEMVNGENTCKHRAMVIRGNGQYILYRCLTHTSSAQYEDAVSHAHAFT
eukprot:1157598-Pelagomonas_calceolata.AAC.2